MMTDMEITKAFEAEGYGVIRIKHWRNDDEPYVTITRGSQARLIKATELGKTLGVKVCQPC